ncbi:response regulator [Endozoicomonas sp. Mp262]|uniref:response regulator n=1 Tax=Endozoicomonas sp. Mp262 TaxID=2919499 RepID=UPI0021DB22AE
MAEILVIDDSPTELYQLTGLLKKHGYTVLTANNGADGIALCRTEKPSAVIMDVVMPGVNGFQATRQLSRDPLTRHIPVIIVTTKDQDTDITWGIRQGAKEYLTKPVNEKALIKTLSSLLETDLVE